jgi:hypothetical protein
MIARSEVIIPANQHLCNIHCRPTSVPSLGSPKLLELRREAIAISDHVQLYDSCLAVAETIRAKCAGSGGSGVGDQIMIP